MLTTKAGAQSNKIFRNGVVIALQADTKNWMARCLRCQPNVAGGVNGRLANTATIHVKGDNPNLPAYAKFKVKNMGNGKIALRADNGFYLARCRGCLRGGPADILTVHVKDPSPAYAQFTPIALPNGKYLFKSDNGKFIARCRGCSKGGPADIATIHVTNKNAPYAQWTVVLPDRVNRFFKDDAKIALRADTKNWVARCLGCQPGVVGGPRGRLANTVTVHVNNPKAAFAQFTVKKMGNGKIALQADNGMYLGRCRGCLRGGPDDIMTIHVKNPKAAYAQFTPIALPNGKFLLKADTGKYLARCRNCSRKSTVADIISIHVDDKNAPYAQWEVKRLSRPVN